MITRARPHPYNGKRLRGEIQFEWADEDTLVLEVHALDVRPRRGEGLTVNIDNAHGSLSVAGAVHVSASVCMTEAEARKLLARMQTELDS